MIYKKDTMWYEIERPTLPPANAPPGDLFPAYDEQPGPCVDDYLTDPDNPAETYFLKTAFGQNTARIAKIQYCLPIYGKMPSENKDAIR